MDTVTINEPKRGPGRPALGRDRIVQSALSILDDEGSEAVTLRAIAKRLSSSTATIYRHVESRSELLGLVMDNILAEADAEIRSVLRPDAAWHQVLLDTATVSYRVLRSHNASASLLDNPFPLGPNGMIVRERMLEALLRTGFPPVTAVNAVATISHYVVGFAVQTDAPVTRSAIRERLTGEGKNPFPATASVVHLLPRPLDEEFAFGLGLILKALEAERPDERDLEREHPASS
ncbi:TetR/AcrR family transcriptional regulator [Agreia sp. Leaf244]|uniref:TetR/AcrR family transcriptional regulator n=1 Tax=Agreia sp. Leaf244 TaxID=1736305 RepID=UPI00138F92E1|nr:TetR/AcrR family transcriptional regulator C-terminal domain-containing protein [Agreia sp. Leaf244]